MCPLFNKQNTILETTGKCGYFSIVQDLVNTSIHMYYRSSEPENGEMTMPTRYLTSNDGIDFSKPDEDIIIQDSGICHNWFAFYDTNPQCGRNKYKAMGGTHWRKRDPHWHHLARLFAKNKPDDLNWKKAKPEWYGFKGVHALSSRDGVNWNFIQKHPIMDRHQKGFLTRSKQSREFDSHLCCFYDQSQHKYMLYFRANIGRGIRHIQCCTSDDFIHWSPCKLITIDGLSRADCLRKKLNYYMPAFFRHPTKNMNIGLIPYIKIKKQYASLKLMRSDDAITWTTVDNVIIDKPWYDDGERDKPKNNSHPVNGIVLSEDEKEIYFYVQNNYFHHNRREPVSIIRYSMPIEAL